MILSEYGDGEDLGGVVRREAYDQNILSENDLNKNKAIRPVLACL